MPPVPLDVCGPLDSLEALLSWTPAHQPRRASLLNAGERWTDTVKGSGRTLVCHDMQGGYLDDRFCDGAGGGDQYVFYHWHQVDEFVYFSHHLVTVPPCGWVQAAHLHGVRVLGTLITEGDDGRRFCRQLLGSRKLVDRCVEQLVALSVHCGVDGWLVNIENTLESQMVGEMLYFVQRLTSAMHEARAGSRVLWYDAVTCDGKLTWQNELNGFNADFFAACDGIFLNYCWTEEGLARSAAHADSRATDVYVGVDVFGRGCPGGGGFESRVAVKAARDAGLSTALFAPGWTHETLGTSDFFRNEDRFWRLLSPYLNTYCPSSRSMTTDFCLGRGSQRRQNGLLMDSSPWYCLYRQSLLPSYLYHDCEDAGASCSVRHYADDSFSGGSCLLIENKTLCSRTLPLLRCHLPFDDADCGILVKYVTKGHNKRIGTDQHSCTIASVALFLDVSSAGSRVTRHILAPEEGSRLLNDCDTVQHVAPTIEVTVHHDPVPRKDFLPFAVDVESVSPAEDPVDVGWQSRYYMIRLSGEFLVTSIGVCVSPASSVLLGYVSVLPWRC